MLRKHIRFIKDCYISEITRGIYPYIGWIDFSNFCDRCKIYDKQVLLSTVDRIFIATNVETSEKMQDNPEKALCRFEFFEILLRVASAKFKETGIVNTYHEALEKLLKEHIIPYAKPERWQAFRDEELWTLDVNDVFEANLEGLKKVYSFYWEPRKKYMTVADAMNLFMKDTSIQLIEKIPP